MKKLLSVLLACILLLGCAASAMAEGENIRVAWWGGQERHNMTIEALDAYAAANNVTMAYEYTSWGSYFENLATQAVGANLPDVLQMSTTDIINYAVNGQVVDLFPFVEAGIIDLSNIEESSLSGGTVNGQLAGFTTGTNTVSVIYNKSVFDQAGVAYPQDDWTWSEYIATVKAIYEKTGIPSDVPFLTEFRWTAEAIVRSYGVDMFSEDGQSLPWAENETVIAGLVSAINDIAEGVKAGYFIDPEVQLAWATTEENYIVQDKSAMAFLLSNYYPTYCNALGAELGLCMLPRMDDGTQSGMYLNSNMYWCISANSANPEAAAAVLNYLINDVSAAKIIGTDRGISLSSAVRTALANDPETDVYSSNVLNYVGEVSKVVSTVNPADPANSAELIAVLKNNFIAVTYGEMTAEDCIADFIDQSFSILPQ